MIITRTLVRTSFSVARLPLTIAEATLQRGDRTTEWPPTLAFEAIEAAVKETIGSLTGDDELAVEGRLERARIAQLREAVELDAVARAHASDAEREYRSRQEAATERKRQIEHETTEREQAADARAEANQRRADEKARRKSAAEAEVEAGAARRMERTDRKARLTKVDAEKSAVAQQRRALAAKKKAARVEADLEAAKAARRKV